MELPEIYLLSRDMCRELTGKRITELDVENVKCLNRPLAAIRDEAIGRRILGAKPRGKWVFIELEGKRGDIIKLARSLGYSRKDFITRDYVELIREFEENLRKAGGSG